MKNIYNPLFYLYLFAKIFGMAPYSIEHLKDNVECRPSGFSIGQALIVIGMITSMIYCRLTYLSLTHGNNATEKLLRLMGSAKIFTAVSAIILIWYHQRHLIKAFDKINVFDSYMRRMEAKPKKFLVFTYIQIFFLVCATIGFPVSMGIIADKYKSEPYDLIVYDTLSTGFQCVIHSLVTSYFNVFVLIIYIRFHYLHKICKKFEDSDRGMKMDPIDTLNNVCVMYNVLCTAAHRFNKVFSFPMFFMVLFNILETLLTLYLIMVPRVRDEKIMLYGSCNMAVVVILLLPTGIMHRKTKGLARYLTECTFCYKNEQALNIRGSFMLQTLQEGILFEACGCFPLSMATFIDQLSVCVSFLLFLYQLVH